MNIEFPKEYTWLLERGLVSYDAFGPLQPWHYLPPEHQFWVTERWPKENIDGKLFAFAKRQDGDELACFVVDDDGEIKGVAVIQGWFGNSYIPLKSFSNFSDWIKYVVDDIHDWISQTA